MHPMNIDSVADFQKDHDEMTEFTWACDEKTSERGAGDDVQELIPASVLLASLLQKIRY